MSTDKSLKPLRVVTAKQFRKNPRYAAAYLDSVLTHCDRAEAHFALRRLVEAFGGLQAVCMEAKVDPLIAARLLSTDGEIDLIVAGKLLRAMGLKLSVIACIQPTSPPV